MYSREKVVKSVHGSRNYKAYNSDDSVLKQNSQFQLHLFYLTFGEV